MLSSTRLYRTLSALVLTLSVLCACGGGRNAGSTLPALPGGSQSAAETARAAAALTAAATNVLSINAGGAATGAFVADRDFSAGGTWTYATSSAIATSGVANPAPQAVYQSARQASKLTYTIPGLTANAAYTVRLDFAELWFAAAGQRVFNVSINGTQVLTGFDIYRTTGARYKAAAESFNAKASSTGTISIVLAATTNYALLNGIEIATGSGTPTPTPTSTPSGTSFVDWPTYGYDAQRSGFNPNTTPITPNSIGQLHVAWQTAIHGSTQSQPIVVANVAGHAALLIIARFAIAQAYDALSGKLVWQRSLPIQNIQDCGINGISGAAQYDRALNAIFMAAGNGGGAPNHPRLFRLDAATGAITGQVDLTPSLEPGEANYAHTGITLANGRIYAGTGSDCEGTNTGKYPSWRGRVVAVDPSSMTLLNTFYTTWGHGGNFGGGGIWSWGGVSADPSGNVYASSGNAETDASTGPQKAAPPFQRTTNEQAGYAEHLVKLKPDLSAVEGSNYPGFNFAVGYGDLDYTGTPVVFTPPLGSGCGTLTATQGKGGTVVINDASNLNEVKAFALSVPSANAWYIGNPAYSPNTGYLYAAITSSGRGSSLLPPGLAAIGACGSALTWHAQFGPDSSSFSGEHPRSAPTVSAGGVVFLGTPCTANGAGGCGAGGTVNGALWAVDAASGAVLHGGKPVLITGDDMRAAPSADGAWLFVIDDSGNLYGLTVDSSVKAIAPAAGERVPRAYRVRG